MDVRTLRYFVAIAKAENFTAAAEALHVTQPTLSKQVKELEEDLGKQLLIRGSRKVSLTADGHLLQKRASEIIDLLNRTEAEIRKPDDVIAGSVHIGGGESASMRLIAKIVKDLQTKYPDIQFHLYSGIAEDIKERLDNGLLDFGVVIGAVNTDHYDFRILPEEDTWGLLVPNDSHIANKSVIHPEDLKDIPLIYSDQSLKNNELTGWFGDDFSSLNIVASYNLIFNASLMVEAGVGYALCLDNLVDTYTTNKLHFIPLDPPMSSQVKIIWKKQHNFPTAAKAFKQQLQNHLKSSI
ncbi:LysR family transcriptional regulator [Aerococcus viridans]|uniref:LysR family transcriptional regulator n=1 Tax=Aerococcus viridans TaxID=1377 RepID=UPI003AA929FC